MSYKQFHILRIVFCLLISVKLSGQTTQTKTNQVKKIVIDAGHGGHDPGCHGASSKEKEVCLSMALKLGKLIEKRLPAVEVVYTRKTDVFVDLKERAAIANKNEADLFICIHANANDNKSAFGSETYVMGLHKTQANLNVAKRENSVILLENNYKAHYEGFDPNSDEDMIALTLMQSVYLEQSLHMASNVQQNFEKSGRKNRGVKQAGFLVLHQTAMPSVLIETGFLTNPEEEKYLSNPKTQDEIAENIYKAFVAYKAHIEKIDERSGSEIEITETQKPIHPKTEETKTAKQEKPEEKETLTKTPRTDDQVIYRVQIKTSAQQLEITPKNFFGMSNVFEYKVGNLYKYTVGEGQTVNELLFLQNKMREKGAKGAFIVAFLNDQRISISEARKLNK